MELSFSGESDWSCHRDTVLYCQDCCLQPRLRSLPSEKGGHVRVLELVFSSISDPWNVHCCRRCMAEERGVQVIGDEENEEVQVGEDPPP